MTSSIQTRIDHIKALLETAETNYSHAIASADWAACSFHKAEVAKYRSSIGKMIRQKLNIR